LSTALLQERFEYIRSELLPFLKSVGFKEQSLQWLPAVGPAGQNLNAPPTEPLLSWWRGPTLVQAIDAFTPKPRNAGVLAAAWVQESSGVQNSADEGVSWPLHNLVCDAVVDV
jgi:translation elongation factor EF-1alpha